MNDEPSTLQSGSINFGMDISKEGRLSPGNLSQFKAMVISITDANNTPVFDQEVISIKLSEANGISSEDLLSSSLMLKEGRYKLVRFGLVNLNGEVTYATPLRHSFLGSSVDTSLPMDFVIQAGKITTINPQVVFVNNQSHFGYDNFDFSLNNNVEAEIVIQFSVDSVGNHHNYDSIFNSIDSTVVSIDSLFLDNDSSSYFTDTLNFEVEILTIMNDTVNSQ